MIDDTQWFDVVPTPKWSKVRGPLSNEGSIRTREADYRRTGKTLQPDGGDRWRCACGAEYNNRKAAQMCCTAESRGNQHGE